MALAAELSTAYNDFHQNGPPNLTSTIRTTTEAFKKSYDPTQAIQVGDKFPAFALTDATGKVITSESLHSQGPILISFYRGEWCPFCQIELRALQKHLPEFKAKGVNLVAITPELPDQSLTTKEKYNLDFTVLSDVGNGLSKQLGIVYPQPQEMTTIFDFLGLDWKARYGSDSLDVPIPAIFLVDKQGILRNAFIEANYHDRLEPTTALAWIDKLEG